MRLEKKFWPFDFPGISGFPVFWSPKQVWYSYPGFECPKVSRNLPKIFPKILTKNKSRKLYRNFCHMSKMLKIYRNFRKIDSLCQKFRYIFDIFDICIWNKPHNWPNWAQKNGQKSWKLYQNFRLLTENDGLSTFDRLSKMYRTIRSFIFTIGGTFSRNDSKTRNCYRNAWP